MRKLRHVKLNVLKLAVDIADTRSMTLTAERNHIGQPSVTTNIQRLEELLGINLFVRSRERGWLGIAGTTDEGEAVINEFREILDRIGKIEKGVEP